MTLANNPADVYLLILDNGLYEVTGGQPTAGTGHADFARLARAAGIKRVYTFDTARGLAHRRRRGADGAGTGGVWLSRGPVRAEDAQAAAADGRASGAVVPGTPWLSGLIHNNVWAHLSLYVSPVILS